jgi:hypothetical protein
MSSRLKLKFGSLCVLWKKLIEANKYIVESQYIFFFFFKPRKIREESFQSDSVPKIFALLKNSSHAPRLATCHF